MKLSIITDEYSQDLTKIIAFAKTYGLDGVEIRSIFGLPLEKLSDEQLHRIRDQLDQAELSVCNLASSFNKCRYKDRRGEDEKWRRLLHAAKVLNAPSIRCFSFLEEGIPTTVSQNNIVEPCYESIKEAYLRPLEEAFQNNITLLLESDPTVSCTNHAMLATLLKTIDHPSMKAIFDPGNDLFDHRGELPYPTGFKAIKKYVGHIHIKDSIHSPNGAECVKIGSGSVPFQSIFKELFAMNYTGYLSLETHYRLYRRLTFKELAVPGGAAFTEETDEASIESILALSALIKEASSC